MTDMDTYFLRVPEIGIQVRVKDNISRIGFIGEQDL